jgi:ABC-type transporter lipoprotein component MlaA
MHCEHDDNSEDYVLGVEVGRYYCPPELGPDTLRRAVEIINDWEEEEYQSATSLAISLYEIFRYTESK